MSDAYCWGDELEAGILTVVIDGRAKRILNQYRYVLIVITQSMTFELTMSKKAVQLYSEILFALSAAIKDLPILIDFLTSFAWVPPICSVDCNREEADLSG